MVTTADVALLPARSVATAVSECVPLDADAVFQRNRYGLVVTLASFFVPSR
jgi:hypothetical protein